MDYSISVNNYKSFSTGSNGFENIKPINIIIGKNNSGKSSLIEMIEYVVKPNQEFKTRLRDGLIPSIEISQILTLEEIANVFSTTRSGGGFPQGSEFEYGKILAGGKIKYTVEHDASLKIIGCETELIEPAKRLLPGFSKVLIRPFRELSFRHLTSERDITPEIKTSGIHLTSNGTGATNLVQEIINTTRYDSKLIEKTLLTEINKILKPDILFTDIVTQYDEPFNKWEIYFENKLNDRIALSKMGSGIKTVLLVLLNLIVIPKIENKDQDTYIFGFEELENNVHPAMLRRLLQYIKEYSDRNKSIIFITTHSNIVIDLFGTDPKAQIIHVKYDGQNSTTKTILSKKDQKDILKDLEIKASDILQSNGIIWVEGPSDRVFLKKWIELCSPDLIEGLHFSVMYYGGRLLSNMAFDYDLIDKNLIPSLHINQNAYVIMDRDGQRIKPRLNATKIRIESEIGPDSCWITHGREIENYITKKTLERWLKTNYDIDGQIKTNENMKLQDLLKDVGKRKKIQYNLDKNKYAKEIVDNIKITDLKQLDLLPNLTRLINKIKEWNGLQINATEV